MRAPLRVLLIEDVEDDAQLVLRELRRGGFEPTALRVETEEAMAAALDGQRWDLIICDHSLPRFGSPAALATLRQRRLDIPFIIVSGTIGEETAVAAMRAGADDYLMKGNLGRLVVAVERELRDASSRASLRRAQTAARESAALYRSLVETLPEGIGVEDLGGGLVLSNERLAAMYGFSQDELLGRSHRELVAAEDRGRMEEADRQTLAAGGVRDVALSMVRKDGTRFSAELSARVILEETQEPRALLFVVRDVTERQQLQARVMLSDRLASLGALAAGVAHEINNPLAYILGNLELVRQQLTEQLHAPVASPASLEGSVAALGEAVEGAQRVREIVRDLKAVSRSNGEASRPLHVQRVVESALRMATNELRHRARVSTRFGAAPPVEGSEGRLFQVFLNLLINAAQAIPEGAADQNEVRVTIGTTERGWARVDISDTGTGIAPEVRGRIFDPFFTTKPLGVGTGLGLALCQDLVAGLGGELGFETEVGKGTVFHVEFPPAREVARPPEPSPPPPPGAPRGRILVVDDDALVGSMLRRALIPRHEVLVVRSGREALAKLEAGEQFDLVLSDLMMPEMTGMELYAQLRAVAPVLARRMVFLTGGAFTARAMAFFQEVSNPIVEKPFEVSQLRKVVDEQLRLKATPARGVS